MPENKRKEKLNQLEALIDDTILALDLVKVNVMQIGVLRTELGLNKDTKEIK